VNVEEVNGRGREGAYFEAHKKYIDVQLCVMGEEAIGVAKLEDCTMVKTPYDAQKDLIFFDDAVKQWVDLSGDRCIILFPDDAHAPLGGTGLLKKIVVKIAVYAAD